MLVAGEALVSGLARSSLLRISDHAATWVACESLLGLQEGLQINIKS